MTETSIRRQARLVVTLLLLVAAVALSDAFGMSGGRVLAAAIAGAVIAGIGAVLCGVFVETPRDSFEHSVARVSLVALAILPPALALRAALAGAFDFEAGTQRALVVGSSIWLVVAAVFTAGALHLSERYAAAVRRRTHGPHVPHPRGA